LLLCTVTARIVHHLVDLATLELSTLCLMFVGTSHPFILCLQFVVSGCCYHYIWFLWKPGYFSGINPGYIRYSNKFLKEESLGMLQQHFFTSQLSPSDSDKALKDRRC